MLLKNPWFPFLGMIVSLCDQAEDEKTKTLRGDAGLPEGWREW
jgi:hypothetical protein